MSVSATSHNLLKRPIVAAMFNNVMLTSLLSLDSLNNPSIYEGWHKPEQVQVSYPYITYRVNWYPAAPTGFLRGTMLLDVWDSSPAGNDTRKTEEICTVLTLIFEGTTHIDGLALVRSTVSADEWIQDEEPGRIHRQVSVELKTVDLFSIV